MRQFARTLLVCCWVGAEKKVKAHPHVKKRTSCVHSPVAAGCTQPSERKASVQLLWPGAAGFAGTTSDGRAGPAELWFSHAKSKLAISLGFLQNTKTHDAWRCK